MADLKWDGWVYSMEEEVEEDNIKYYHYASKSFGNKIKRLLLDLNPYSSVVWFLDYCEAVKRAIEKEPFISVFGAEPKLKDVDWDINQVQFYQDICILVAYKNHFCPSPFESQVYSESLSRLKSMGNNLMKALAAQKEYESLKDRIDTFKQVCKEDGIKLNEL